MKETIEKMIETEYSKKVLALTGGLFLLVIIVGAVYLMVV